MKLYYLIIFSHGLKHSNFYLIIKILNQASHIKIERIFGKKPQYYSIFSRRSFFSIEYFCKEVKKDSSNGGLWLYGYLSRISSSKKNLNIKIKMKNQK